MKYLLPETWLGRVVVAWIGGLVLAIPVNAVLGGTYFEVAFYCLVVIMAVFIVKDALARRGPRENDDSTGP